MTSKIVLQYHRVRKVVLVSFATIVIVSFIGAFLLCWFSRLNGELPQRAEKLRVQVALFEQEDSEIRSTQNSSKYESPVELNKQEFVVPVKIKRKSKVFEYANKTKNVENQVVIEYRSDFRDKDANSWDMTPEYEIHTHGQRFHLVLNQESEFMHPDLKITFVSKNSSNQYKLDLNPNCFYSGNLKDESASFVTVNLCNGMRGIIRSPSYGTYSIEPANTTEVNTNTFYHILKRIDSLYETSSVNENYCATKEELRYMDSKENLPPAHYDSTTLVDQTRRRKRSTVDEYTIELLIAVDKKVAEFHGRGLQEYILTLMREVRKRFKDNSVGNSINVVLVKWIQLEDDDIVRDKEHENTVILDLFCDWQYRNNNYDDDSPDHHDAAILITRDTICSYDHSRQCSSFLGLAQVGSICSNNGMMSCAAVKDNGIYTAFTITHELGHILNIPHDEDIKCAPHRNSNESVKIMTHKSSPEADPWSWSSCSRHFLTEFLEANDVNCLHDNPLRNNNEIMAVTDFPGKTYSADKQCELIYGKGWKMYQRGENCSMLWCYNPTEGPSLRSESGPWADGTICGSNHWCRRKKCVPRTHSEKIVHGGWSEWHPYSECTRPCGGGVRKSLRSCNNPHNSNGGDYCKGKKVLYQSCNTHKCPPETPDFRLQQCSKFNNDTTQWVPHYRQNSERERCSLVCNEIVSGRVHTFNEYVIDGTSCDKDLNYGVCVNGKCMKTGCDHALYSNLVFDNCGICGGNNSTCKPVRKEFNKQTVAGYTFLDTIPAGASYIDIQQFSHNDTLDDKNYLALRDPQTKHYILNGQNSVSPYNRELQFEGITIEYGGSLTNPERINTLSRLPRDLVLEILSLSNAPPFRLVCQYILPMAPADYFKWEVTNEWSNCDKTCYGEQVKLIRCIKKETGNSVYSESCAGLPKPRTETRVCNEFCTLSWKAVARTECSVPCGEGVRKITYRCYQENRNRSDLTYDVPHTELPDMYCSHMEKPNDEEIKCTEACITAHWRYYEWEPCSVTCGKGVRIRRAVCVDANDREIDESACASEEKRTDGVCYVDKCPQWTTGQWSPCSVSCGKGERKRMIWCEQNNRMVSHDSCRDLEKPTAFESCHMPPCAATWLTGEWSQCSVNCGAGSMVRTVRCSASDERECLEELRPAETQYCYLHPCTDDNSNEIWVNDQDRYEFEWRNGSWGDCSATCGKGMKQRSVKCYNVMSGTVVEDEYCVSYKAPPSIEECEERSCPMWKTTRWSSCSVSCGRGFLVRNVWCEGEKGRVDDKECMEMKPIERRTCEMPMCPTTAEASSEPVTTAVPRRWRVGRWGDCSVTCGGGIKTRNVVCLDDRGNIASDCIDHFRPASLSPCNTNLCADQVKWKYGDWSQCNQTCGGGYQHRQAQCTSTTGENVPETYCSRYEHPILVRQCENNPCSKITYQWKSSLWSKCSVTCGMGVYTRSVRCYKIDEYNIQSTEIVNDSFCTATRPISEKECQLDPCKKFTYKWRPGPWSECSVSCGSGMQKRWTDCQKVNEQNVEESEIVPEYYCDKATRPAHHQECQLSSCPDEFFWVAGQWGECTGVCGNKKKKRKLYCYQNGKEVHRSLCRHLVKPKRRRKCPQHKCEPTSCLDIKKKYRAGLDREYILNILGRNISIYCHEMWSSHPKEYLTLSVGTLENYSEYYSKRLKDPDSCPRRMTRLLKKDNSIVGLEENNNFAGRTVFHKLRLNVTSMQVLMDDYTFATSEGYSIPVGQAGDCYSKRYCPQGSFSINVKGSGLRIAPSTRWDKFGDHAVMHVKFYEERRIVVGKCGGYCATCRPVNELKLDVLPP